MKRTFRVASVLVFVVALVISAGVRAASAPGSSGGREPGAAESGQAEGAGSASAAAEKEAGKSEEKRQEKKKPAESEKEGPEKAQEKPAEAGPVAVGVKREAMEIKISLDGAFEARSAAEIAIRPKQWTTFKVLEAVEHGATVQRGEVLIRFDTEAIDQTIADQRASLALAELALKQAEQDLKLLEASTPLDLALAARNKEMADEDLARFLKVDREMNRKSAENSLENAKNYLEYEREELRQLEKMYKADDLTEETEEIVLKRQRDAVKRAEFSLELAKQYHDESLQVRLPRLEESLKQTAEREGLSKEQAKVTLPVALRQKRLEVEKMRVQQNRDQQKLEKLLADRELMAVKSPTDGVVYYGKWSGGKWSGTSTAASRLRQGGSVPAHEVVMTIVRPRPLLLRVTVPEKELHWIHPGLEAVVKPAGFPDLRLSGRVGRVSPVPVTSGSFEAELSVRAGKGSEALMPGMSAKVTLVPYRNRDALTVPVSALSTSEPGERKVFVRLVTGDGRSRKRRVEVGRRSGDRVEILGGLTEGEKVLKTYPKDED